PRSTPTGSRRRSGSCRRPAGWPIGSIPRCSRGRPCSTSPPNVSRSCTTSSWSTAGSSSGTRRSQPWPACSKASARRSHAASPWASSISTSVSARRVPSDSIPASSIRCSASSPTAWMARSRPRRGSVSSRRRATRSAPATSSLPPTSCSSSSSRRGGERPTLPHNKHFIAAIRHAIGALQTEFTDVQAGVTGTPALSNDEMLTAFRDSTGATLLAFALTLAFLILVFRRVVTPLLMLGVLMVSLAWSLGIIAATVGHLTVFSVVFISLLIGIGIDYGIYVFFRYEEEARLGRTPARAFGITASQTGPGVLFGALTAAGTFGVLALTEFRGIQEFGFIAGTAILISFVSMVTFFPAVVVLMQRHARWRIQRSESSQRSVRDGVPALARLARYPVPILFVAVLLTAGSLAGIPALRFDYNR